MIDSISDPWEAKARPLLPILEERMKVDYILTPLFSRKLITKHEWDELRSLNVNKEKVGKLIVDILPSKDQRTFAEFVDILRNTEGQEYLAELITQSNGEADLRCDKGVKDDELRRDSVLDVPLSRPAYQAKSSYVARTSNQISFNEKDWVVLLEDISADWCSGCANGRIGLFPRTSLFGMASTKRMDRRRVSSCSSFHSALSESCERHGINDPIERCVTDPILSSSGAILSLKQLSEGLPLQFQAFLHPGWGFDTSKQVVSISFSRNYFASDDSSTSKALLPMKVEEIIETAYGRLFMISSSILTVLPDLPEASLIEYHYVVTDDYKHEFKTEMLELPPDAKNSSCNRALSLCSKHAENGLLIQRDGVVEQPTPQSWSHWFKDCFSAEKTIEKKCLEAMAPKWFDCDESDMLASEAVRILDDVVESLISTVVKVSSFSETSNVKKNINVKKLLCAVLKPKISKLRTDDVSDDEAEQSAVYATAIAVLVEKYLLADLLDVADFETLASALILRFDASTRTCRSLDRIIAQFSHKKSVPLAAARYMCNEMCKKKSWKWVFAMPLVHLLSGSIEPFEKPPLLDWESQEWWFLEGLDSHSIFIAPPLESSIFTLTQLDSLLLRNVLFALNLKDLSKWKKYAFHIELVTTIVKKMRNQNLTVDCLEVTQVNFLKENLEQLYATTNSSVNENIIDSHLVFDDVKWRATVVVELLQRFSHADSLSTNLSSLLLVLVHLLFAYISILGDKATTNVASISRLTTDLTDEVCKVICGWIRKFKSGGESLDSILMFCDNFLKIEVVDSTLSELLVSVLSAEINSLLEERGKEVVIVFCQIESLSCHSKLRECVAKFTARALEDVITKDKSLQALLDTTLKKCPGNSHDVLSNRFLKLILSENAPDKEQSNEIWLRSILTWPLWKTYFFDNDFSDSDRDILLCISKAKTVVADVVQLLEEDRLSVTHFDTSSKRYTFLEVCGRLDAQTPGNSLPLRHKARVALEKAFKAEKRILRNFLRLCEELGNVSLNEISEKIGDTDAEPVLFTGFKHLQPYIEKLNDLHGSIVFQDLWHEHTSQPLEPVDSLEKLLQSVIRPIFASWKRLYVSIKRGTVTAFDVQRYFGKVFLSKENLEQELKMMLKYIDFESSLSNWLNERIEQILLFGRRHFVCSISKLVRKICEALGAERITLCPIFTFNEKEPVPSLENYPPLLKQFLISLNPERIAVLHRLSSESESFLKKIKDVDVDGQTVLQDLCHIWSIVSKYQVLVGDNI